MREPRIHSAIRPMLDPEDEWLLDYTDDHADGQLHCAQCGFAIYNRDTGTIMTWVQTGWMVSWHDEPEPGMWCLWCFAHKEDSVFRVMNPIYGFNDDGTMQEPQSMKATPGRGKTQTGSPDED